MERKIVLRKWLALLLSGTVSLMGSGYADGEEEQYEFEQMQGSEAQSASSVIVTDDPKPY